MQLKPLLRIEIKKTNKIQDSFKTISIIFLKFQITKKKADNIEIKLCSFILKASLRVSK